MSRLVDVPLLAPQSVDGSVGLTGQVAALLLSDLERGLKGKVGCINGSQHHSRSFLI